MRGREEEEEGAGFSQQERAGFRVFPPARCYAGLGHSARSTQEPETFRGIFDVIETF